MMKEPLEVTEVEYVLFDFSEALLEAVSEKESAGEISSETALRIYSQLSHWQNLGLELCTISREKRLL